MKFKSILGAFLFVCLATFLALFFFVQTQSFGVLLTKIITDIGERKAQTKVSIKNVELSFFPPGLELNKVKVSRSSAEEILNAEFGKLGFYLNLIEIEERRLSFGEIRISDSIINYNTPEKEDDTPASEIPRGFIDKVFDLADDAPVRVDTLIIENSHIHLNHDLVEARRLKIFKKSKEFIVRFHLANIKPSAESDFRIDEVWGDLEIGRKKLQLYRLKVLHDVQSILLKGKIDNYHLLKRSTASLVGEAQLHLKDLDQDLGITKTIRMQGGFGNVSFNIDYQHEKLQGKASFAAQDFQSSLLHAKNFTGDLTFNSEGVVLQEAQIIHGEERARLLQPVAVYDFSKQAILPAPLQLSLQDFRLNNALRIEEDLRPLDGKLTGNLTARHDGGDFLFRPHDGFAMSDVTLIVGKEKPVKIIHIQTAKLRNTEISIVNKEVRISSSLQLPRSSFSIAGQVNKNGIKFSVRDGQVNLEDLGNIANLDIKGSGPLNVEVSGPLKDVLIHLQGQMRGFEVLGYKLGQADVNTTVALEDDSVLVHKMESVYGSTPISVTGAINYDNGDIALGINSPGTNYYDISQILQPIFRKMDFLPEDLSFQAKIDASIFGKTRMPDLKVKSSVQFKELSGFRETINSGQLDIRLQDQILVFEHLTARKGKGVITGDFTFVIPQDALAVDLKWNNLELSSLNFSKLLHLNLDGSIDGSLSGAGKVDSYELELLSKMTETRTHGYTFDDSEVALKIHPKRLRGDVHFLGQTVISGFDMSLDRTKASKVNLQVALPQVKPIMVAFFGPHIQNEDVSGRVFFDVNTSFYGNFTDMDFNGHLKELTFTHPEFKVNHKSETPDFIIQHNIIKKWKLDIREPDLFVVAKGSGEFGKQVSLIHEFHVDSKLFEILVAPVLSAEGFIRNIVRIDGSGDNYWMSFSSKAKKLSLSVEGIPFPLNDLEYAVEYSDRRLAIQDFKTTLQSGSVSMEGDVFFEGMSPDINVKYVLDRAEIPVMGKSLINVSGEGIIIGNEPPYNLTGEVVLNKALIVNEINEFNSRGSGLAQVRFLPKNQETLAGKLINLNLTVKADNPIKISNSLMDVSLRGEVRLTGSPSRPKAEGRLSTPANSSRVYFKNNEYVISSADINFSPKKDIANPDFDIQALTFISNYKIYAKAYGDLERFNFDLTSDPALPRNSIFSLIAFGYTDEIENSLRPEERQSLTQIGVGSFVLDRFKINDILNKQFGVQVNLGTVFEQSQTDSLLAGRTQEAQGLGTGDLGRIRSAAKIELKKRLDEAVSLSVSSTMGGSIGSRQSMNLTYNLSRKVQLEGVYELRTAAEGEEDTINNSNSIGGDLKFRWTFK